MSRNVAAAQEGGPAGVPFDGAIRLHLPLIPGGGPAHSVGIESDDGEPTGEKFGPGNRCLRDRVGINSALFRTAT